MLIDGKEISKLVLNDLVSEIKIVSSKINRSPSLNIILVGENPASLTYVKNKLKKCSEIGINGNLITQSKNVNEDEDVDQLTFCDKCFDFWGHKHPMFLLWLFICIMFLMAIFISEYSK